MRGAPDARRFQRAVALIRRMGEIMEYMPARQEGESAVPRECSAHDLGYEPGGVSLGGEKPADFGVAIQVMQRSSS